MKAGAQLELTTANEAKIPEEIPRVVVAETCILHEVGCDVHEVLAWETDPSDDFGLHNEFPHPVCPLWSPDTIPLPGAKRAEPNCCHLGICSFMPGKFTKAAKSSTSRTV